MLSWPQLLRLRLESKEGLFASFGKAHTAFVDMGIFFKQRNETAFPFGIRCDGCEEIIQNGENGEHLFVVGAYVIPFRITLGNNRLVA